MKSKNNFCRLILCTIVSGLVLSGAISYVFDMGFSLDGTQFLVAHRPKIDYTNLIYTPLIMLIITSGIFFNVSCRELVLRVINSDNG